MAKHVAYRLNGTFFHSSFCDPSCRSPFCEYKSTAHCSCSIIIIAYPHPFSLFLYSFYSCQIDRLPSDTTYWRRMGNCNEILDSSRSTR